MSTTAAPGWYPDGDRMRYWNGMEWTDQTRPAAQPSGGPSPQAEWGGTGLALVGYVLAVLLPPIGFVLGIVAVTRPPGHQSRKHGVRIIVLSIVAGIVWIVIALHSSSGPTHCGPNHILVRVAGQNVCSYVPTGP
jgi:Protein of unknown function (DUF2510)